MAIDTGSNGGIAIKKENKVICTPYESVAHARSFFLENGLNTNKDITIAIETLNIFSSVNGSKNTVFKQGIHFGECIGLLYGFGLNEENILQVSARKWQKPLNIPEKLPYNERKEWLCNKAEELFPVEMSIKNTKKYKHSVCDSLLILNFLINLK